jgi:thiol-disulfide isomerase/thioredoxin
MSKGMTLAVLLLLGGITVFVLQYTHEPGNQPRTNRPAHETTTGQPAPGFRLKDLHGQEVSLEQLKGKVVMLDFWATWCAPCRQIMPELEKLQQEHLNDFTLLAVNLNEDQDLVAPFVKRQNIQSRVLLDLDGSVARAYGVESIPMQAVIDKNGVLQHTQLGLYAGWKEELWAEVSKLR